MLKVLSYFFSDSIYKFYKSIVIDLRVFSDLTKRLNYFDVLSNNVWRTSKSSRAFYDSIRGMTPQYSALLKKYALFLNAKHKTMSPLKLNSYAFGCNLEFLKTFSPKSISYSISKFICPAVFVSMALFSEWTNRFFARYCKLNYSSILFSS